MISIPSIIGLILIGLATGTITSLVGASGVVVVVPMLTMLFGADVHSAIGTSLMVDVIASLVVSYGYFRHGNVDLKSGLTVAVGSLVGAQLGALWSHGMAEGGLGATFSGFLVLTGVFMLVRKSSDESSILRKAGGLIHFQAAWQRILTALGLGIAIGIMSGFFGAGGGVMILLVLVAVLSFPLHLAIGTSTMIMAITAASGALGYGLRGSIDLVAGVLIGLGSVIGGSLGANYANRISEGAMQKAIGIVFLLLGIMMSAIDLLVGGNASAANTMRQIFSFISI